MKYAVKNLTRKPDYWIGTLEWWEGCHCSAQSKEIKLYQETRPTIEDFKEALHSQGL